MSMRCRRRLVTAGVMEDQYARLMFEAHRIRIVPTDAPVIASSCTLWEYEKAMPVAFVETDLANVFVQDPGCHRADPAAVRSFG